MSWCQVPTAGPHEGASAYPWSAERVVTLSQTSDEESSEVEESSEEDNKSLADAKMNCAGYGRHAAELVTSGYYSVEDSSGNRVGEKKCEPGDCERHL